MAKESMHRTYYETPFTWDYQERMMSVNKRGRQYKNLYKYISKSARQIRKNKLRKELEEAA